MKALVAFPSLKILKFSEARFPQVAPLLYTLVPVLLACEPPPPYLKEALPSLIILKGIYISQVFCIFHTF